MFPCMDVRLSVLADGQAALQPRHQAVLTRGCGSLLAVLRRLAPSQHCAVLTLASACNLL